MAFIALFFNLLFIYVAILTCMGLAGLILIVISVIKRKKQKKQGKKPSKLGLITGSVLISIPMFHILVIVVIAAFSNIKSAIRESNYTCLTDKWRNENVYYNDAKKEAIEEIFEAAEAGDKDRLINMFPLSADKSSLEKQIDDFLKKYPKGLSKCERDSEDYYSYETEMATVYEIQMDGKWYYVELKIKHQQDENDDKDDSDEVGVTLFTIESEEEYLSEKEYGNEDYIYVNIESDETFETRRIFSTPYIFTPIDRKITEEEAIETVKEVCLINEFIEKYGEPNAIDTSNKAMGKDYFYEIVSDDDKPRYIKIDTFGNEIYDCYICSEEETDYKQWIDIDK